MFEKLMIQIPKLIYYPFVFVAASIILMKDDHFHLESGLGVSKFLPLAGQGNVCTYSSSTVSIPSYVSERINDISYHYIL